MDWMLVINICLLRCIVGRSIENVNSQTSCRFILLVSKSSARISLVTKGNTLCLSGAFFFLLFHHQVKSTWGKRMASANSDGWDEELAPCDTCQHHLVGF